MKAVAMAVLFGLALIAGAIALSGLISPTLNSSAARAWGGYEDVIRSYFALNRVPVENVNHVDGPYYTVKYKPGGRHLLGLRGTCALVDLSKSRGVATTGVFSVLWVSAGPNPLGPGAGARQGCG